MVQLGRLDEARLAMQAVLHIKPTLTVGEAQEIFDYVPDSDTFVDALPQAGLPE
jgi:hypothetical protein